MNRAFLICTTSAALLLTACEKPAVNTYTVPKQSSAPAQPTTPAPRPHVAPAPPAPAAAGTTSWPTPQGWTLDPMPRQMRLATFRAGPDNPLEVALSEFPGDTGGLLANVNRWRGQVGLEPTTLEAFQAESPATQHDDVTVHLLRLRGPSQHMLGAILHHPKLNRTRFLKATGAPAAADQHEPAFKSFAHAIAEQWGKE
ncbi:MAG TPA: hypothetical protein VD997_02110 [Phycisphaerales bacterium]|nr:hypothetical protein [Phycisphaerales bacterium]